MEYTTRNYISVFFSKVIFFYLLISACFLYILLNEININLIAICAINSLAFIYFYHRTNSIASIIFLVASVNYIILFLVGFFNLPYSYLQNNYFYNYYDNVAFYDLIFYSILFIFVKNIDINIKPNNQFALVSLIIGISFIVLNLYYVFPYLGQEYAETFDKQTSLNEYGWLCLSLWLLFYKDSFYRIKNISIFIVFVLFVISVFFGARLQLSMLVIALLVKYLDKFNKFNIFLFYLFFVFGGILLGILRELSTDNLNLEYIFSTINQGASLHASSVYLAALDEGYFSSFQKLSIPIYTFFLSPFISLDVLPNFVSTQMYILGFSNIQGNGGMIGFYTFFYFGLYGLIISPIVFSILMRLPILAICFILLSFRWQLYNIAPFLKVLFFSITFFCSYNFLIYLQRRRI